MRRPTNVGLIILGLLLSAFCGYHMNFIFELMNIKIVLSLFAIILNTCILLCLRAIYVQSDLREKNWRLEEERDSFKYEFNECEKNLKQKEREIQRLNSRISSDKVHSWRSDSELRQQVKINNRLRKRLDLFTKSINNGKSNKTSGL